MSNQRQSVVLITGASSGIGQACATHLCARGFRVYGTSRRAEVASACKDGYEMIVMDVTDDTSV